MLVEVPAWCELVRRRYGLQETSEFSDSYYAPGDDYPHAEVAIYIIRISISGILSS